MEITEIKKLLYKEKPKAFLQHIRKGNAYYQANVNDLTINFEIPVIDMGDADFFNEMDAKLLIRWILKKD